MFNLGYCLSRPDISKERESGSLSQVCGLKLMIKQEARSEVILMPSKMGSIDQASAAPMEVSEMAELQPASCVT